MSVLNAKVPGMDKTTFPPFEVTGPAIQQIEALGGALLIDLVDGGCCGTAYAFNVVKDSDAVPTGTERFGCPGAWLFVSDAISDLMPGATLDYSSRLKPPRFRVLRNPNTPEVCPCRRSFGEPWPGPGQPTCRSYLPMPWDSDFDPPARWKRQTGYQDS